MLPDLGQPGRPGVQPGPGAWGLTGCVPKGGVSSQLRAALGWGHRYEEWAHPRPSGAWPGTQREEPPLPTLVASQPG